MQINHGKHLNYIKKYCQNEKVLITGGAGFVGFVNILDKKFEVIALDNLQKFTGAKDPKKLAFI